MQNELKSAIRFNDIVAYFGARGGTGYLPNGDAIWEELVGTWA